MGVRHERPRQHLRSGLEIYGIVSNTAQKYTKLGYLDTDNVPQITDTGKNKKVSLYTLGNVYPYFDLFKLEDPDPAMFDQNDLYSNLSVLIRDWDIRIGGKKYDGPLMINEKAGRVFLALDLDDVTLIPGDHIRLNIILMPWAVITVRTTKTSD